MPIDKANSKVAFFCQKHFPQVLNNELSLNNDNNINARYIKATNPVDTLQHHKRNAVKKKLQHQPQVSEKWKNTYTETYQHDRKQNLMS